MGLYALHDPTVGAHYFDWRNSLNHKRRKKVAGKGEIMVTPSTLAGRYQFNAGMLSELTRDFTEADWGTRQDPFNAAHWILAHIVRTRRAILRMLGDDVPTEPWEEVTKMGSPPDGFMQAPSAKNLLDEFRTQGTRIKENLLAMSAEDASKPLQKALPDGSKTVGEGIHGFFYMHESYHIGQIGVVRRLLGKPGIV